VPLCPPQIPHGLTWGRTSKQSLWHPDFRMRLVLCFFLDCKWTCTQCWPHIWCWS
jgi:hypothetical protein